MKKLKKILTPILAGVMLLSACSEGATGAKVDYAKLSDVEFWSTYTTDKVIQNNVTMYEDMKQSAQINVTAIRGEEEAAQIIMTARSKPVKEYDIVLNDLILVTGSYSESSYENQLVGEEVNLIESSDNLNLVIESVADSNKIKIIKGNIYCSDVFYESDYDYRKRALEKNVLGIEMETFALFHNARMLGKEATALLTVSDLFYSDEKLTSSEREKSLDDMIVLALESCLKL